MKITKIGHCCFLIEENGVTLLTDPGAFTTAQNAVTGVDAVLITHEHRDHFHIESVKTILKNNPRAVVITNTSVGALLKKDNIEHVQVGQGEETRVNDLAISGHGKDHEVIFESYGLVENTGYMIGDRLYFPGDAFHHPGKPVEILGLPVYAPWMRISDALNYAFALKPKAAFPIHDGPIKSEMAFGTMIAQHFLTEKDIQFIPMKEGDSQEF